MTACGQSISGMDVSQEGELRGDYSDGCHSPRAVWVLMSVTVLILAVT